MINVSHLLFFFFYKYNEGKPRITHMSSIEHNALDTIERNTSTSIHTIVVVVGGFRNSVYVKKNSVFHTYLSRGSAILHFRKSAAESEQFPWHAGSGHCVTLKENDIVCLIFAYVIYTSTLDWPLCNDFMAHVCYKALSVEKWAF